MQYIRNTGLALILATALVACDEHSHGPDDHDHDHDVISRVEFDMVPAGTSDTATYVWDDADGPGGANPNRIDTIFLDSAATYLGSLRLINGTLTPFEDLTADVRSDMDEHQFFFTVSDSLVRVSIQDLDERGLPVGLATSVVPVRRGTGTILIELSHFDDPSQKTGTNRSDETDLSISFPIVVR
jgi:hypothetical protein